MLIIYKETLPTLGFDLFALEYIFMDLQEQEMILHVVVSFVPAQNLLDSFYRQHFL